MEILPFEEVEFVADAKVQLQQGGVSGIQQHGYYNIISAPLQGFSEDSSDEDDYMAPLGPRSEEGSVCCVCGENIPLLNKLIDHFKTHTAEVSCHLCWTKFGQVMSLAVHLKNAHPRKNFMCGICRTLFRCTWRLNGHMEKHRKDIMEVKPVVKVEQTEEISIRENIRYTDMRQITLMDHSYCVSDQAATNDTYSAIQKHIDNDTNSTNQESHIETQTERLALFDKQNDTLTFSLCPWNQSEREHLSFKLKVEYEDGLGETAACETAAEDEIRLMEDDESTDTDEDVNTYSLLSDDTAYNLDDDFSSESDGSDSRSSSCGRHQSVNTISPAPDPPHLTLQQLLQTTPLVPAKVSDLVPQFVAMPQTLIRPHFPHSSCVARPKIPVHIPSVVRPLMSNLARMTPRFPTTSNSPFPSQDVVSFSPTVNISAPCLVSANRPVLRQTPAAKINVPLMTSVTCPTLVSALTEHNQPQIPPAQVQAPLQIVAMFVNQSRDLALQKRLKQSWRSKTIFPCRHCGAVSRQPSLKVRHRYLHRGSRLYRCQCGRSFQGQLHLLRHQIQHAESVRFVCAQCGNTFEGAHKLTWHKQKHRNGRRCVKKTCKAAFDCSCGQMFTRPSALLWHMLQNSKLSKHTRKNSDFLCK